VPGGVIEIIGTDVLAEDVLIIQLIKSQFKDSLRKSINHSNRDRINEIINKYSDDGFVSGVFWKKVVGTNSK